MCIRVIGLAKAPETRLPLVALSVKNALLYPVIHQPVDAPLARSERTDQRQSPRTPLIGGHLQRAQDCVEVHRHDRGVASTDLGVRRVLQTWLATTCWVWRPRCPLGLGLGLCLGSGG